MRCSKCQYIGFDSSDRCRNCGYEFSLAADTDELDLPLKTGDEPAGPLEDFPLSESELDATGSQPLPAPSLPPTEAARRDPSTQATRSRSSGDLPLFRDRGRDADAPLVSLPASPRAPVAVRKSATVHRPAQRRPITEPELELGAPGGEDEPEPSLEPRRTAPSLPVNPAALADGAEAAPLVRRILAAMIDVTLLAGIDAVILYFTLKLSGLEFGDARLIPVIPFAAFIALLNGGYVASFTAAGGQTIGKMVTGIRVVTSEEGAWSDRVPVESAALRAVGYLICALPAGLGFLPVLVGPARRGLHDRLAHTRVVRA